MSDITKILVIAAVSVIIDCILYAKLSPCKTDWGWWNKMPISGFLMAIIIIRQRITDRTKNNDNKN